MEKSHSANPFASCFDGPRKKDAVGIREDPPIKFTTLRTRSDNANRYAIGNRINEIMTAAIKVATVWGREAMIVGIASGFVWICDARSTRPRKDPSYPMNPSNSRAKDGRMGRATATTIEEAIR